VREDITRLEVDVMVNSADEEFEGIGALARTVFLKGGVQLREAVQTFGKCQAGDVRLTPGYSLPAKNILHVIPPDQFRQNTKDIMRKIYREVLYNAVTLGAASIALPSIGERFCGKMLTSRLTSVKVLVYSISHAGTVFL
jgi:O-acetyl-ADP-ribose deacetylase (regulator of RNase III)